jgi:multiple antibiotic resistance protein
MAWLQPLGSSGKVESCITSFNFRPYFCCHDRAGDLRVLLVFTQEKTTTHRRRTANLATLPGPRVGLLFVELRKAILSLPGVQVVDFLAASGIILLIVAIRYLVIGKTLETKDLSASEMIGVVPLDTPLVAGPAGLAALLLLMDQSHIAIPPSSFILDLAIQWALFRQANRIVAILGQTGVSAVSDVIVLLLAALAVKMIHEGILAVLG